MKIDLFVHPQYFILPKNHEQYSKYKKYLDSLQKVKNESELAIVLKGEKSGEFEEGFSSENTYNSLYRKRFLGGQLGQVKPEEWGDFKQLLTKENSYRIHGAFYGRCVAGVALQIYSFLNNKNWFEKSEIAPSKKEEMCKETKKGYFRNCNIHLGQVAAIDKENSLSLTLERITPDRHPDYPKGGFSYQLEDDNTKLHIFRST